MSEGYVASLARGAPHPNPNPSLPTLSSRFASFNPFSSLYCSESDEDDDEPVCLATTPSPAFSHSVSWSVPLFTLSIAFDPVSPVSVSAASPRPPSPNPTPALWHQSHPVGWGWRRGSEHGRSQTETELRRTTQPLLVLPLSPTPPFSPRPPLPCAEVQYTHSACRKKAWR